MSTIKKITDKSQWQKFWSKQDPQLFVQAWEYQDFCTSYGDEAFFISYQEAKDQHPTAGSIIIHVKARRGNFFYLPYGPICSTGTDKTKVLSAIVTYLKQEKANLSSANFIKISPFWEENTVNLKAIQKAGFIKSPIHILAEVTWVLDLNKPATELMPEMRQNHRNLIRRSKREGVIVESSTDSKDISIIHDLLKETAQRHKFVPFSKKYLLSEFNAFAPHNSTIYIARHNNEVIAGAIFFHIGDTMVYHHGASKSSKEFNKLAASYAIQWQAINDAIDNGLKYYNFWGIAPEDAKNSHPFKGITRFKKGFGGHQINLVPCHDFPLNKKYWLNYLLECYRKFKRGF